MSLRQITLSPMEDGPVNGCLGKWSPIAKGLFLPRDTVIFLEMELNEDWYPSIQVKCWRKDHLLSKSLQKKRWTSAGLKTDTSLEIWKSVCHCSKADPSWRLTAEQGAILSAFPSMSDLEFIGRYFYTISVGKNLRSQSEQRETSLRFFAHVG